MGTCASWVKVGEDEVIVCVGQWFCRMDEDYAGLEVRPVDRGYYCQYVG